LLTCWLVDVVWVQGMELVNPSLQQKSDMGRDSWLDLLTCWLVDLLTCWLVDLLTWCGSRAWSLWTPRCSRSPTWAGTVWLDLLTCWYVHLLTCWRGVGPGYRACEPVAAAKGRPGQGRHRVVLLGVRHLLQSAPLRMIGNLALS